MTHFKKHFTIEEARALMPGLRKLFEKVHAARDRMRELDFELGQAFMASGGDFGGEKVMGLARAISALHDALMAIADVGVQVKDLERGLVDFPAWRDGKEVFLCWELDEKDIGHWHELETGYGSRKKL